jgi:hypothetical protein
MAGHTEVERTYEADGVAEIVIEDFTGPAAGSRWTSPRRGS